VIHVVQLGLVEYATALRLQQSLVELRKQGHVDDVLLFLEHSPVITLGRNAQRGNLLKSEADLGRRGVQVFECDRGGDVTFHGPGQLVAYPIFDLREFTPKLGAVAFVRKLEEVLILTCREFGIVTQRISGLTGVWTAGSVPAKIAAIGVHISRGVTSHGFALNVTTDLDYFRLIVPCGISDKPVTSMAREVGRTLDLRKVADVAARCFGEVFGADIMEVESLDALVPEKVGVPMKPPRDLRALFEDEIFWA
jgi:lipoyl(octanoyl) transferase